MQRKNKGDLTVILSFQTLKNVQQVLNEKKLSQYYAREQIRIYTLQ